MSSKKTPNIRILLKRIQELEKNNAELRSLINQYRSLVDGTKGNDVSKDHKDRLFNLIFGNPENKQWTLSLYNAVNGSNYTDAEAIQFNTLENVVYMRMKNDVSFLIASVMNLWEHQSTFNPNMPLRFLIYAGRLYDKYTQSNLFNKYSSKLQPIPTPKCVCFYNGLKEQAGKLELKLSHAFAGGVDGDIEVKVTMININHGMNLDLMEACEPLKEYAWFVEKVRSCQRESGDIEEAVHQAIEEMPEEFLLKAILLANMAEVKGMFLEEYNEEEHMRMERQEAREEERNDIAVAMIKNNLSVRIISKVCGLSEAAVLELAALHNIKV